MESVVVRCSGVASLRVDELAYITIQACRNIFSRFSLLHTSTDTAPLAKRSARPTVALATDGTVSTVLKICLLRSYYPDVLEEHGMYAQTVLLFL
jgi:hypothetical protein